MKLGGCIVKSFNALLKYHFILYVKSNKIIMPLIAWITCMYGTYSAAPVYVVSSFVGSMTCLFFIMAWVSFSYFESIDSVSEQLIILKVKKQSMYYFSVNVFLMLIGVLMSIIGVVFPIIQYAIFHIFTRNITVWDVFSALLLHIIFAVLGCSLGILFQPRCMKNRKIAIELLLVIAIMSIVKMKIIQKIPEANYITWIFPPISEIQNCFSNTDIFYLSDIIKATLYGIVYSFVLNIINTEVLKRKRF
jgi:hypothetical protein